jgi:hypothetical protein
MKYMHPATEAATMTETPTTIPTIKPIATLLTLTYYFSGSGAAGSSV